MVRLDLDPDDVIVDENCVLDLGGFVEVISNSFYDEGLNFMCWNPADSSGLFRLAPQNGGRDVVPILDAERRLETGTRPELGRGAAASSFTLPSSRNIVTSDVSASYTNPPIG
jgi:hypothetical protein